MCAGCADVYTDSMGRFTLYDVPAGRYRMEIVDPDSLGALVDFTVRGDTSLTDQILIPWCRVEGDIALADSGANGCVQVYGMERIVRVSARQPTFSFDNLPQGSYRFRATTTDSTFGTREIANIRVVASQTTTVSVADAPYSMRIYLNTRDGAGVESTLTSFPVCVNLERVGFDFPAARADGGDLRFWSMSGRPLAYELEYWNALQNDASVWIRLDTVRGALDDQYFVLGWGDHRLISASAPSAVFSPADSYAGVWHLSESAPGVFPDATGGSPGRRSGGLTDDGVSGLCAVMSEPSSGISCGPTPSGGIVAPLTITATAWFSDPAQSHTHTILTTKTAPSADSGLELTIRTSAAGGTMTLCGAATCVSGAFDMPEPGAYDTPEAGWYLLAAVVIGDSAHLYVNGERIATQQSDPFVLLPSSGPLILGGRDSLAMLGLLDDVTVESTARSDGWIRLRAASIFAFDNVFLPPNP